MNTGLITVCATTIILLAVATILVLSLIPVYLPNKSVSAVDQGRSFNVDYSVPSGSLPLGDVSMEQRDILASQLSKMSDNQVTVNITSANVKSQSSKQALVVRQTDSTVILQVRGTLYETESCSKNCFTNAKKQFRDNLCTSQLLLI